METTESPLRLVGKPVDHVGPVKVRRLRGYWREVILANRRVVQGWDFEVLNPVPAPEVLRVRPESPGQEQQGLLIRVQDDGDPNRRGGPEKTPAPAVRASGLPGVIRLGIVPGPLPAVLANHVVSVPVGHTAYLGWGEIFQS